MRSHTTNLENYQQWGEGTEVLLAFHGVGQTHRAFDSWKVLDAFTVYAFDLPYHGENATSESSGIEPLTKDQWKEQLREFLSTHGIDTFSVAGFSMGGRFALACVEAFPERIRTLYLLAPDGIQDNPWYAIAMSTSLTRSLFRYVVFHPSLLTTLAVPFQKLGLIHPSDVRFVKWMLGSPAQQRQVYQIWTYTRKLRFSHPTLRRIVNAYPFNIRFFMGHFDRLMTPQSVQPFHTSLDRSELVVLKCGHQHLIDKTAQYLQKERSPE